MAIIKFLGQKYFTRGDIVRGDFVRGDIGTRGFCPVGLLSGDIVRGHIVLISYKQHSRFECKDLCKKVCLIHAKLQYMIYTIKDTHYMIKITHYMIYTMM